MYLDLPGRTEELSVGDYVAGEMGETRFFRGFVAEIVPNHHKPDQIYCFSLRSSVMSHMVGQPIRADSVCNNVRITRRR
jgi:hypothetical protein